MKALKKTILMTLVVITLLSALVSCVSSREETDLYELGEEMIGLMQEMASNDYYLELYSVEAFNDMLHYVAKANYTTPKAVYSFEISKSHFEQMIPETEGGKNPFSDELEEIVFESYARNFAAQLISRFGASAIAASGVCALQKTVCSSKITVPTCYLYVYESAPSVIITFIPGEDNTVSANGTFILPKELQDEETLIEYLNEMKVTLTQIDK